MACSTKYGFGTTSQDYCVPSLLFIAACFPHADVSRRNNVNWQLARPYLKQHNYSSAASTTLRLSSQPPVDKNEGAQLPVLDSLHHSKLPAPN